jgi:hypothetical protein
MTLRTPLPFQALNALLADIGTAVRASREYSNLSLAASLQPASGRDLTGMLPR